MIENIFLLILLLITVLYNGYVIIKSESIPESISATSYFFKDRFNKPYLFTLYCVSTVAILFPIWLGKSPEEWQFLVFLSCGGILFAGVTPFFREDFEKPIHYIAGIIAVISCIIWMFLNNMVYVLITEILLIIVCMFYNKKNYVYYIEIIGLIGLVIKLFK